MAAQESSEGSWRWSGEIPAERFRAPIEMFWRGLGYEVAWSGSDLRGHRELDGQRREVAVTLRAAPGGGAEVLCRVRFIGSPPSRRPNEVYRPDELTRMLESALARGFGPPG